MVCESLTEDLVQVNSPWGLVLLLLNIFIPGLGTIINSCMGDKWHVTTFIVGLLQMLFASFLLGWIWSIWWGILILSNERPK